MRGEAEYRMRENGLSWMEIASRVGAGLGAARDRAYCYARKNNLSLPKITRWTPGAKRTKPRKDDGERWHKMHIRGIRSTEIAEIENVDIELVRKTLGAYRKRIWG